MFIVCSGSLKDIATVYGVSYPTVRNRLDKLIRKIENYDKNDNDLITTIKMMSIEDRLSIDDAKILIGKYRVEKSDF